MVVPKNPKIPDPAIPPFELENERDEPLAMLYIIYCFYGVIDIIKHINVIVNII
jgi:hypothetical protein